MAATKALPNDTSFAFLIEFSFHVEPDASTVACPGGAVSSSWTLHVHSPSPHNADQLISCVSSRLRTVRSGGMMADDTTGTGGSSLVRPDPARISSRVEFNHELGVLQAIKGLSVRALAGRCGYAHGSVGNFLNPRICALPNNEGKTRSLLVAMGATAAEVDAFIDALRRVKEAESARADEELTASTADLPADARSPLSSLGWLAAAACLLAGLLVTILLISRRSDSVSAKVAPPSAPTSSSRTAVLVFSDTRLLVAADGRCIRSQHGSNGYNVPLVLGDCTGPVSQQWRLINVRDNDYRLVNDHGRCLGAHDARTAYQGTKLDRVECQTGTHFFWRMTVLETRDDESIVTLFNVGRIGCLEVLYDGLVGLSPLCDQRPSQVFRVRSIPDS